MKSQAKICAVVVTHNRIRFLQECVESLRNQIKPLDCILVVNNDSNDGTKEWLEKQTDLIGIHQENLGGAGGFHNGLKKAYELGFDWIWCMDDDCLPHNSALQNIFQCQLDPSIAYNSLILSKNNKEIINFGLYDYIEKRFYERLSELSTKSVIHGGAFFNGSLFSRDILRKVRYPKIDFFIYGDDYEYYLRMLKNNVEVITCKSSVVFHPEQKYLIFGKGKFFYRWTYFNTNAVKYFPRNIITIWFYYNQYSTLRLLKTLSFDLVGILVIQRRIDYFFMYIYSTLKAPMFIFKLRTQFEKNEVK